jgi:hypothetical protein
MLLSPSAPNVGAALSGDDEHAVTVNLTSCRPE